MCRHIVCKHSKFSVQPTDGWVSSSVRFREDFRDRDRPNNGPRPFYPDQYTTISPWMLLHHRPIDAGIEAGAFAGHFEAPGFPPVARPGKRPQRRIWHFLADLCDSI